VLVQQGPVNSNAEDYKRILFLFLIIVEKLFGAPPQTSASKGKTSS
jgi:hypothetical protein